METTSLVDYIKFQVSKGLKRIEVTKILLETGWTQDKIDEAFNIVLGINDFSSTVASQEKKPFQFLSKKSFFVVTIIAVFSLVFGGGTYAYFNYFQSPEKVLSKMLDNVLKVDSIEYFGNLTGSTDKQYNDEFVSDKKLTESTINFSGITQDIQAGLNQSNQFNFDIKTNAISGEEASFNLQTKMVSEDVYFKIGKGLPSMGFFDFIFLEEQWIKISLGAIKEKFASLNIDNLSGDSNNVEDKKSLTEEQINNVRLILKNSNFLTISKSLPSEKIDGINTFHYQFLLDKVEFVKLLKDLNNVVSEETIEEDIIKIEEKLEELESFSGEIWIGKKDFLPHKLNLDVLIKAKDDLSEETFTAKASLLFKNFNKDFKIDLPTDSKNFEDILLEMFGGFGDFSSLSNDDAFINIGDVVDTDGDGMSDDDEIMFGMDPNNPDTDGDGIGDNDDLADWSF
jgi:hypothetical protein